MKNPITPLVLIIFSCANFLHAWEYNHIDIHGFFDQGYLASSGNNYFGDTTNGTWQMTQAALNASANIGNNLRLGGQLYTFRLGDIGGLTTPQIDWLYADYHWKDTLSFRLGKVKQPKGLYGDALDLEMTRPYIFLPQSLYAASWRDFSGGILGGSLYGTLNTHSHGSFDYNFTAGSLDIRHNSGLLQEISDDSYANLNTATENYALFGQLTWNTPTKGLRLVASSAYVHNLTLKGFFKSQAELDLMPPPHNSLGAAAALLEGAPTSIIIPHVIVGALSAEYLWHDWTFAAEYSRKASQYHLMVEDPDAASLSSGFVGQTTTKNTTNDFYLSASYRVNPHLELGSYYSIKFNDIHDPSGSGYAAEGKNRFNAYQKDFALCARYDITPWWIVKIEGHLVDGTFSTWTFQNQPWQDEKRNWAYGALQNVFYF